MVNDLTQTNAALDSIFGQAPQAGATEQAFSKEARSALNNEGTKNNLTIRMAQNVFDCYPSPLTADKLQRTLDSANLRAKVELIRSGNDKLKSQLPCIFWQGTLDIRRYAEANKPSISRGERLPSAVNKDKYFTLATPFCFIDIDQPHDEGEPQFDPFILFGKVQHHAPQGETVFAQAPHEKGCAWW